ncbi:MAG TPA: hypothetical protein PKN63_10885 [Chitinophagales bacterium]|nr:hypothetical protein [Chitinophagales bacterium]
MLILFIVQIHLSYAQNTTSNVNTDFNNSLTQKSRLEKLKDKGLSINGSIGTQFGAYYVNGIPNRQKTFSYQLHGEIIFRYKDIIELPFSFIVGESERKFNQPFNQIGVSPKYKWLTAHAGFRNISWSQYSMAGKNMLCVGIEANPKYFRSGILFGRISRGTSVGDTSKLDSLTALTYTPSYRRLGLAVKVGAGTENNYIDLIYFRAWDRFKKDSLFILNDVGIKDFLSPSENAAFSIVTSNKIGKYVTLKAEYAISTTNKNRLLSKTDTLPDDYIKVAKILLKPNASSIAGHAANFNGIFTKNMYSTNLTMELVTQNYISYGAYYFPTNTYRIGVMQSIPLHKNKSGNFNINVQYVNDNLNKKKPFVNNRIMSSLGYNFNNAKFGISTQYALAYSKQKIVNDSIKGTPTEAFLLHQSNHTFVLSPRLTIIKNNKVHTLVLIETINALADMNKNTRPQTNFINNLINLNYIAVFAEKNLSIQSAVFSNYIKNALQSLLTYGLSIGTNSNLLKNKLGINNILSVSNSNQSFILNANLGLMYRPEKHHLLSFTNNLIWNKSHTVSTSSFIEYRSMLSYTYSFF